MHVKNCDENNFEVYIGRSAGVFVSEVEIFYKELLAA
jgi:hypothetical protein